MEFKPFIYNAKQEQIPVSIAPMTDADAQKTTSAWQTAWTSDYLSDLRLEKYAAKLDEELIALGAYEILKNALVVHIAYHGGAAGIESDAGWRKTTIYGARSADDRAWNQALH